MSSGYLEIILGAMFSGKTTELMRRARTLKAIDRNVLIINHSLDSRNDQEVIMSHDLDTMKAIKVADLCPLLNSEEYQNSQVICIDEAQFFTGLLDFVKVAVDTDNKHVIVCGLDGDYLRRPFGEILQLIPICDRVEKLAAYCMELRDGTPGIFTKRIIKSDATTLVGGKESYHAVCRKKYFE